MSEQDRFLTLANLLPTWRDDVLSGHRPTLYPVGDGFERIEIGPGLVTLLGGAPGQGKTALTMQWVLDALASSPSLRALVCNVEMTPTVLMERQLARLADLDGRLIRHRRFGEQDRDALERGFSRLQDVADRLAFVEPPFTLDNVASAADAFEAELIVLDYIQRIGSTGSKGDRRGMMDAVMSTIRQFADAGVAVLVIAALARSKDGKGRSSYASENLSLASFRETSEIEYGADDAYILANGDDDRVLLRHLKSRHGETQDVELHFDRSRQRFTPIEPSVPDPPPERTKRKGKPSRAELQSLWDSEGSDRP